MNNGEGTNSENRPYTMDRRQKEADWVTNAATILSLLSWLLAFGTWWFIDQAQPEKEHMFSRMFGIAIRDSWDTSLVRTAFFLMVISFAICVVAMILNKMRKRRKTDKYKKSIIIIGIITVIGIVAMVIQFSEYLIN